jgi:FlaA1/EpsC-like NDP-sugar epimerase
MGKMPVSLANLHELPRWAKRIVLVTLDCFLLPISLWLAVALYQGAPAHPLAFNPLFFVAVTIPSVFVFGRLGLYRAVMRYVGHQAFVQIIKAVPVSVALLLLLSLLVPAVEVPLAVAINYGLVAFALVGGSRWAARWVLHDHATARTGVRVAIYGAGDTGRQLASILKQGIGYRPVCFIDDSPALAHRSIDDLVVMPAEGDLEELVRRHGINEIFLSIPSASASRRREVLGRLERLPVHVRSVPSMNELVTGVARVDQLREIRVEELLGRDPVPPIEHLLRRAVRGKTVLISGAGGSIGSELARQALALQPRTLLLLDFCEYFLYELELELAAMQPLNAPDARIVPLLGSVADENYLAEVFSQWQVDTVFHAAAYKHVPLVEMNPYTALANNVLGTVRAAQAAIRGNVERFVLISTDKAVRPTNVMGATKRLAEMAIQALADLPETRTVFGMVRLGNVLGSSGSVVPRFAAQIRQGGPVTVTHAEVTRYFMTIPEAVQLVIQAGAMARGGEVFVLDMGQSVKILELARKMIRLSGRSVREPGSKTGDIEIRITGLRPGEKLHEELLIGDAVERTAHSRILRAQEAFVPWPAFSEILEGIAEGRFHATDARLKDFLDSVVDGYHPALDIVTDLPIPADRPPPRPVAAPSPSPSAAAR